MKHPTSALGAAIVLAGFGLWGAGCGTTGYVVGGGYVPGYGDAYDSGTVVADYSYNDFGGADHSRPPQDRDHRTDGGDRDKAPPRSGGPSGGGDRGGSAPHSGGPSGGGERGGSASPPSIPHESPPDRGGGGGGDRGGGGGDRGGGGGGEERKK
jgi:hypothetical protein